MVIYNKKYTTLIVGALIIVFIAACHFFALFDFLNGVTYDYLTRHGTDTTSSENVLLLDGERQFAQQDDTLWKPLLKNILANKPKQVVFNFLPAQVSADFYQIAAESGKVVFGRHLISDSPYSKPILEALPSAAQGKNITWGVVKAAASQNGVHRSQSRTVAVDKDIFPTLEGQAERSVTGASLASDYWVNFLGGTARIPKMQLSQATEGAAVAGLMAGRTVFVGVYGQNGLDTYFTPLTASEEMPDVLFHALALDTLLSGRAILALPDGVLFGLIAAITFATLAFCQFLKLQQSLFVSLALSLAYLLACWFVLHSYERWMPFFDLLVAQWLAFAIAWRYRIVEEAQALNTTLYTLSVNLQEKAFPASFYHSQDPWAELIVMINQALNLNRMIFLERLGDQHRLKEIKAYNCTINDVVELRRDFERIPYSTAIQEQKPIVLGRHYLRPIGIEERQFLAPLIFAGDVLGFWAFTVEPGTIDSTPKFLALTQAFMTQISEILYYRQQWQNREAQGDGTFWAYLNFNSANKPYEMLGHSLALLDKRIAELQQVFNSLNSGGVLYDLFGRVLLLNKYMEDLARSEDLKLYNMTALDFIAAVTGYDMADVRQIMQKTIFDRETFAIPVADFKAGRDFILHIRPLKLPEIIRQAPDPAPAFQLIGILCELEDVTELKAIYRLKEQMFERFNFQIRNDLASVVFALSILEDTASSVEEKEFAIQSIQGKIEETLATLKSVDEQMAIDIESLAVNSGSYPNNGQEAIKKAVENLSDYAATRFIDIQLKAPKMSSLVFASPVKLYSVMYTLLTTMVNDTFEGAKVLIQIEEKDDWVHFYFTNNGIGIISEHLPESQNDKGMLSMEALNMETVIRNVKDWGGKLTFSSQVGKGSNLTLSLKRFL
jgi:CHASE2 domain-containing sensor protein/signal transduction histidine kinase